ncbi:MAG: type II secretion system GspH family protein [Puniceicoccales bacterium]|jgi:prepilin-type N-terminal cleavage/methylation domain-containing protein|nr:type II secretion system GspH family protein [Puniceicoccales bacterium]
MKHNSSKGFTLIEVLAVIAIIGILATLLTPSVGSMLSRARKTRVLNNLRQISIAYTACANDARALAQMKNATIVAEWAAVIARETGVNDPSLYIILEDYLIVSAGMIPKTIISPAGTINGAFVQFPLGINVITNIPEDANPATTPLAFTRGLAPTANSWSAPEGNDGGVYGADGGFIVFLDGHVSYYKSLGLTAAEGELVRYSDGTPTNKISDTLGGSAKILTWHGIVQ